jgi:hypothetical protein
VCDFYVDAFVLCLFEFVRAKSVDPPLRWDSPY